MNTPNDKGKFLCILFIAILIFIGVSIFLIAILSPYPVKKYYLINFKKVDLDNVLKNDFARAKKQIKLDFYEYVVSACIDSKNELKITTIRSATSKSESGNCYYFTKNSEGDWVIQEFHGMWGSGRSH